MSTIVAKHPSSYRDPSGFIFEKEGAIYRQVNTIFREHFDHFINSGCYRELTQKGLLVSHEVVNENFNDGEIGYCTLKPEKINFISYPYEWSFDMLKDAALLTLQLVRESVPFGIILKDAIPYNIQWHEGKLIFNANCSGCHGSYGNEGKYPNLLIPENIIATDSLLLKYYSSNNGYEDWYNKSWYATAYKPAYSKPQFGYVAQPLDGIWITAPYFHNGSVPTIDAVLNSKIRPRYWKRNFDKQEYDYKNPGWKYKTLRNPGGKKTYNTDIPGYGNYGHYFGDHLTDPERKAVIEYLKTL